MKRRVLSFILAFCMIIALVPITSFAIEENDSKIIEVPADGLVIVGGTYYGISKGWFEKTNPNKESLLLSVELPDSVTTVCTDGFRDSWSTEKKNNGVVTANDNLGRYNIVDIDFSKASNLTTIKSQAAMGVGLKGVLDLSNTKLETLEKSVFSGCTGITGVILPNTLKNIGTRDAGSVFNGCTGLQFVRTAGCDTNAAFELPNNLEIIGRQSFKGCTGFPQNTTVTIPESVTFVGSEAFHNTDSITTIFVQRDDASSYDGGAFKGNNYGIDKRLTVFKNSAAKKTFTPSGSNSYSNSLTYEFTLHYGKNENSKTEKKLYGQAVNVSKVNGVWNVDENYKIPKAEGIEAPTGYEAGWAYGGKLLTPKTILRPNGDDLYLDTENVLMNPTIEFIVDGKKIECEDTQPELNLSNDKEHQIGVDVSHPIESAEDADVNVKFEYKWTDVWQGGTEGPRMEEEGFGADDWGDPLGKNTISINGPEHERTSTGNYSGEDYGDGYYLLEVYGYSRPKEGGQWKLFYKSASTVIGADPNRTVNTAYIFDVVTSEPAEIPTVTLNDIVVKPGYEKAQFVAELEEKAGQTYSYQWYEVGKEGQTEGGIKIENATDKIYDVPLGKQEGSYYYYLEITTTKAENNDTKKISVPVKMTVESEKTDPQEPVNPPTENGGDKENLNSPETRDDFNMMVAIALLTISLAFIGVVALRRKYKK